MNEEDLMFYAAMAAGHQRLKLFPDGWYVSNDLHGDDWHLWQPLTDDGDALRLAVKLGLCIEPYPLYEPVKHSVICKQRRRSDQLREHNLTEVVELYRDSDPASATRRAIVHAAAKIGPAA